MTRPPAPRARFALALRALLPLTLVVSSCASAGGARGSLRSPRGRHRGAESATTAALVRDEDTRARLLAALDALATAGTTRRVSDLMQVGAPTHAAITLSPPSNDDPSGPALYRRLAASTVVLGIRYQCQTCSQWHLTLATGFVVGDRGEVVTSHHVLADTTQEAIAAMDASGEVHPVVGLVADDPQHDLVILRIEGSRLPALPLGASDAPAGSDVAVMAHSGDRPYLFTTGVVSRVVLIPEGDGQPEHTAVCITAPFAAGASGAAVTDLRANVVGVAQQIVPIHSRSAQSAPGTVVMVVPMAVPVSYLRALAAP